MVGNFDNNNIPDTARLWVPLAHTDMFGCTVCPTEIRFSNGIETIKHTDDVGYRLENIGDMNGDQIDDIAYCPDWYMGCRRSYEVYIINNKQWKRILGMEFFTCNDTGGLKNKILKIDNNTLKLFGVEHDGTPTNRIVKLN